MRVSAPHTRGYRAPGNGCGRGLERNGEGRDCIPATKTFLALRIAVNREVEALGQYFYLEPPPH